MLHLQKLVDKLIQEFSMFFITHV